ncbi:MAG: SH3 domain-containing protein, partial [Spirochaetales bacterium]|nr:SH3 domain-containing protein [Spirochaetales bacterium]
MKNLIFLGIFLFVSGLIFSNSIFKFPIIDELSFGYSSNSPFLYEYDNNFYFEGYSKKAPTGIYKIDLAKSKLTFVTETTRIYCLVDSRFYIQYTKNSFPKYGFYNLQGDYIGGFSGYKEIQSKGFGYFPLVYYQESITFSSGQEMPSGEEMAFSNNIPIRFSGVYSIGGSYAQFENYLSNGNFISISPDKMHLIERDDRSSVKILKITPFSDRMTNDYKIPDPQVILELKRNYGTAFDFDSQFITSSLFISMINYGRFSLYHIEKGLIDEFTFQANGEDIEKRLKFSKDLTRAMAGKSLVDTSEFKNYLVKKGLLFKETTGTILSDNIEAFENANIHGKVQGKLKSGTEVKVIDQSGAKDTFEGKTDYWYQIQSDKIIGWVFGSHLAFEGKNQKISDDSNQAKPEKT